MDTIFMNSANKRTSKPHVLILKLTDKLHLRRDEKSIDQILVLTIHGKTEKAHTKIINLKYQLQHGMMNLNFQMDHIMYQIFKIILSIFEKNIMKIIIILQ